MGHEAFNAALRRSWSLCLICSDQNVASLSDMLKGLVQDYDSRPKLKNMIDTNKTPVKRSKDQMAQLRLKGTLRADGPLICADKY